MTRGNPRELHTELALDAINFKHHEISYAAYQPKLNEPVEW